nr:unnamed protein product [Digitaria exilis]
MEIPTVDLRGMAPGAPGWEATRDAVTASMVAHGCVVVAHDALGEELRRALFDRYLPEIFKLPLETKQRTPTTKGAYGGYSRPVQGLACERIGINEPANGDGVRAFADILWPEGNPEFCETMVSFAKNMLKLDEMLEALVLEGLGVRADSVRAHLDLLDHGIQLSYYGAPPDAETSISMPAHYDYMMNNVIVQHEVEGLEVRLADGRWVDVPPEPDTFTFVAGEQLRVLQDPTPSPSYIYTSSTERRSQAAASCVQVATNGRLPACYHRVRTPSSRERFVVQFGLTQKPGMEVRALDDLVDEEHSLAFNPLRHEEYFNWRYSEEGFKVDDALKAFSGVEKVAAMV